MGELGRAMQSGHEGESIIRFFPRDSPLVIVGTPDPGGAAGPVLHRVMPPDSVRAHLEGENLMCAFGGALGGVSDRWRYAGRGRFEPPIRDVGDARAVEWTIERGRWVVGRITVDYYTPRPVLGTGVDEISPDTAAYSSLPEERRYASRTEWYLTHRPVTIAGRRLFKYGLPRRLSRHELEPLGTLGAVPFFAEKGGTQRPQVVYALVGPDEYQPYQNDADTLEDFCGSWW
jgi:hypothetical protein